MADCSILNFTSCLPEKFMEYLLSIINALFVPLLNLVKDLLAEPVNISLFQSLWVLMVYILSIFYVPFRRLFQKSIYRQNFIYLRKN